MNIVRRVDVVGAVVVASVAGYLGFLGWHAEKTTGSDGYQHGPYAAWQVAALVVLLGGMAVVAGRAKRVVASTAAATVVITVLFSLNAATDPGSDQDGLWPVGALMVAVGVTLGFGVVASLASRTTR